MASMTTEPENDTFEQTLSLLFLFAGPVLAFVIAFLAM